MKPMLRGIAVAVAAVGVVACVQQAWRVTYAGPGDYSYGAAVVQGKGGLTYMAGNLLDQTFLAAYDGNGGLRWQVRLPGQGSGVTHRLGREIAVDNAGDLYVSWYSSGTPRSLIKLQGSNGKVLMNQVLEDGSDLLLTDMQLGPDGNLYFIHTWADFLIAAAYSPTGELLWKHIDSNAGRLDLEGGGDAPVRSLDQYRSGLVSADLVSSAAVSRPILSNFLPSELVFLGQQALFRVGDVLMKVDDQGNATTVLAATDVGLSSIQRVAATGAGLLAIGTGPEGTATAVFLNQHLEMLDIIELNASATQILLSARDGDVCIAAMDGYTLGSPPVQLFKLDQSEGIVWQQSVAIEGGAWEFSDVLAASGSCYLMAGIFDPEPKGTTVTWRYDQHGVLTDTILLEDFLPGGMLVQGKSIYHVGTTGEYDGSITLATLDKKTL